MSSIEKIDKLIFKVYTYILHNKLKITINTMQHLNAGIITQGKFHSFVGNN